MRLPIAGGRPVRPATHPPIPMHRLMGLAVDIEEAFEAAGAESLTPELAEEIAADVGASVAHVYVAAAMMTQIACDTSATTRFEICVGGCQQWGAVAALQHLLKRHEGSGYGIVAKNCLDQCEHAPMVFVQTPDGRAALPEATPAKLDEAIDMLAGESG
jgi:NADH:ubiquinone oxidoreductase subunit E